MAYGVQEYRQQDVMGSSPVHLIVMAYDVAIQACDHKQAAQAARAVTVLRDALNFEYPEAAVGLFRIYQWCLECVRSENYAAASAPLRELRAAWASVEKQQVGLPARPQYAAGYVSVGY